MHSIFGSTLDPREPHRHIDSDKVVDFQVPYGVRQECLDTTTKQRYTHAMVRVNSEDELVEGRSADFLMVLIILSSKSSYHQTPH
jgi:hypothetical protein